jgi:hypothetical protein
VLLLQVQRQSRRARGAVALADQILRAAPAAVAREVEADEFAHRVEVALVLVKLGHLLALDHPRVARADGIDEHQVAVGQQRVLIVDERIGRWRRIAHFVGGHALGPENPEVQPHAARAGAAVETEGHRPLFRLLDPLQRVSGEKERGARLVALALPILVVVLLLVIAQDHRAAGGGVFQRLPADDEAVLRDDDAFLGLFGCKRSGIVILGLGHGGRFPCVECMLSRCRRGADSDRGDGGLRRITQCSILSRYPSARRCCSTR